MIQITISILHGARLPALLYRPLCDLKMPASHKDLAPYIHSLCTVNIVAFIIILPAEEVAWQVYSPPWDVLTELNSSVLIYALVITWSVLLTGTPSGSIHCIAGSPINESPSARMTVQVREKDAPAVGIS